MIVVHLVIGAAAAATLFVLLEYASRARLTLAWWQWTLTVLAVVYAVFVVEVVVAFLAEGSGQAAAVMGLAAGLPAVVWGVLLARFAFRPSAKAQQPNPIG
jgi:hypothetical protein